MGGVPSPSDAGSPPPAVRSQTGPNPPSPGGTIRPSLIQLPTHSTFSRFWQVIRRRSHEAVRRAPENTLSGSVDSDGMERMSIAIRLSRGNFDRCSGRNHHSTGVHLIANGFVGK